MNFLCSNYQLTSFLTEEGEHLRGNAIYINDYDVFKVKQAIVKYENMLGSNAFVKINATPIKIEIEELMRFYFTSSIEEEQKELVQKVIKTFYSCNKENRSRSRIDILLSEKEKENYHRKVEKRIFEIIEDNLLYKEEIYGRHLIGNITEMVISKSDFSKNMSLVEYCSMKEQNFTKLTDEQKKELTKYVKILFKKDKNFRRDLTAKIYDWFHESELLKILLESLFVKGE